MRRVWENPGGPDVIMLLPLPRAMRYRCTHLTGDKLRCCYFL